jgi:two-component system, OmpR family, response regulator
MNAKVLLIEETPEIGALIARCLATAEIDCTVCATGVLGFLAAVREHYDALILDADCPASEARAVVAGLKRLGRTPVIILTEWGCDDELSPWRELGVAQCISKPFSPTLLTRCVQGVVLETRPVRP